MIEFTVAFNKLYLTKSINSLATPNKLEQWLKEGIVAAKSGQLEQARFLLLDVVEQDQTNETAWYWLYRVFDRLDDKRVCLENLIIINPQNQWAKRELLEHLTAHPSVGFQPQIQNNAASSQAPSHPKTATPTPKRPVTLKLVAAFWLGISLVFLTGGIISGGEWLTLAILGQISFDTLTIFHIFSLLATISFIVIGFLGLYVTATLFLQSMIGFYGSILLALLLLLVGPSFSLISNPPNYSSMICIGGIAGMIVLLTLASQPGFKDNLNHEQDTSNSK